ncbi:imidazole glycerol phosphate synthase subunit HisH [Candidatus Methylacidiphilum infernorum]|uniref:Imidazole glycerol phosphate synthase subunit HisH n=1 Tax=Methylacidiphilum infernorum (isolate V4) TaxID=481448 RepID=B3DY28_METI4|nr:imidazole glycerol phosphate synthase subunit HisH [Candidatus Methylacidiphilum infernorum]ACD83980.1 Glutamine amidotransferase [Methylacidiphilum infernorum V4]
MQNLNADPIQADFPVGLIDYGMGNLQSVENALTALRYRVERVVFAPSHMDFLALVLPGVGAFGDCMKSLQDKGFLPFLKQWISTDMPFLGICLGYQILFEESSESDGDEGLGIFKGKVLRFPGGKEKVPHMGWNSVQIAKSSTYLEGISSGDYFYFVHSYYPDVLQKEIILLQTDYGGVSFSSAISRGNLLATQFHPEKSHKKGIQLLTNFLYRAKMARCSEKKAKQ